ncbi:MAG: LPP20 family lipoprotein [Bacteroidota bacterium]
MFQRILLLSLLFIACSPSVNRQSTEPTQPDWLRSRPASGLYYSGIGHSTKGSGINHIQAGKKSALEDLAGDIRVNIQATSALSVMNAGKQFSETYEQIINTSVADDLEDHELADSWETATEYWVYYRLSKAQYQATKRRRLEEATTLAFDFFNKAREAEAGGKIAVALGFSLQGLRAMEKYLAEPVRVTLNGNDVLLNTELTGFIQLLLDRIQLTAVPATLSINRRQALNTVPLLVKATDKKTGKPLEDLTLNAEFEKGAGDLVRQFRTGAAGEAPIQLSRINSAEVEQSVRVTVEPAGSDLAATTEITRLILSRMVLPQTRVMLQVKRPVILLTASERMLGTVSANARITNTVRNFLTARGFSFTTDPNAAELNLELRSSTEKGSISGSLYITYLDAVIRIVSATNGQELYTTSLDRIKGYSLDYERSGQDATGKAIELLEKEKLPALLEVILQ